MSPLAQQVEATLGQLDPATAAKLERLVIDALALVRPAAEVVPARETTAADRPKVGEITSAPVRWTEESFAALDEQGMKSLGLL